MRQFRAYLIWVNKVSRRILTHKPVVNISDARIINTLWCANFYLYHI